jgi:hypothetical protein
MGGQDQPVVLHPPRVRPGADDEIIVGSWNDAGHEVFERVGWFAEPSPLSAFQKGSTRCEIEAG